MPRHKRLDTMKSLIISKTLTNSGIFLYLQVESIAKGKNHYGKNK